MIQFVRLNIKLLESRTKENFKMTTLQ